MRRPAFTMIEVLAALAITVAMMLVGVHFGSRYVTGQRERAYLQRVQSEWRSLQTQGELEPATIQMQLDAPQRTIVMLADGKRVQDLPLPASLVLLSSGHVDQAANHQFAQPQVIYVHSQLGYDYRFAFEMGWGKLIVTKVDAGGS